MQQNLHETRKINRMLAIKSVLLERSSDMNAALLSDDLHVQLLISFQACLETMAACACCYAFQDFGSKLSEARLH